MTSGSAGVLARYTSSGRGRPHSGARTSEEYAIISARLLNNKIGIRAARKVPGFAWNNGEQIPASKAGGLYHNPKQKSS